MPRISSTQGGDKVRFQKAPVSTEFRARNDPGFRVTAQRICVNSQESGGFLKAQDASRSGIRGTVGRARTVVRILHAPMFPNRTRRVMKLFQDTLICLGEKSSLPLDTPQMPLCVMALAGSMMPAVQNYSRQNVDADALTH